MMIIIVRLLNLIRFALVLLPYVLILQLVMLGSFAKEIQENAYFLYELINNLPVESNGIFFTYLLVVFCLSFIVSFLSNGITISLNKSNQIAIRKNEKLFRTLYRLNHSFAYILCIPCSVVIATIIYKWKPDIWTGVLFIVWIISLPFLFIIIFRPIRKSIDNKLLKLKIRRIINNNNLSPTYWSFEDDTKDTIVFFSRDYKFAFFKINELGYGLQDFSVIQNFNVSNIVTSGVSYYRFALDCFNKERDHTFSIVKNTYRDYANHIYNKIKILFDEYNNIQNNIEPAVVEAQWSNVDSETGRININ